MGKWFVLQILGCFLFSAFSSAQSHTDYYNWGLGPVEIGNPYPIPGLHLHHNPATTKVLANGSSRLRVTYEHSNTFVLKPGSYIFDGEARTLNLSVAHSFMDDLEFGINVPFIWRGGGFLDSIIDDWHQAFSLPRGKRPSVPADRFVYSGINQDRSAFIITDEGFRLGGVTLGGKYLVSDGDIDAPAVSLLAKILLPSSDSAYGQDKVDLLGGVLASKRFGEFILYSGLGFIYYTDDEIDNLPFRQEHIEGFLNLEYEVTKAFSLNLAFYGANEDVSNVLDHPDFATYIDTGLKYKANSILTWELTIRENPGPQSGTSDIAFLFGAAFSP